MTDYAFYHLTSTPLEKALPRLMEKVLAGNLRAVIVTPSEAAMDTLNAALWTYSTLTFLPHGSTKDPFPAEQPIYLTTTPENPNQATVLVLTGGIEAPISEEYTRVVDMFDGANDDEVAAARARWKTRKAEGHTVTYLQQAPNGNWQTAGQG